LDSHSLWLTLSLADGETLAAAFEDPQFAKWTKEDQFDAREAVNGLVAQHMATRTTSDWEARFASQSSSAGPIPVALLDREPAPQAQPPANGHCAAYLCSEFDPIRVKQVRAEGP